MEHYRIIMFDSVENCLEKMRTSYFLNDRLKSHNTKIAKRKTRLLHNPNETKRVQFRIPDAISLSNCDVIFARERK